MADNLDVTGSEHLRGDVPSTFRGHSLTTQVRMVQHAQRIVPKQRTSTSSAPGMPPVPNQPKRARAVTSPGWPSLGFLDSLTVNRMGQPIPDEPAAARSLPSRRPSVVDVEIVVEEEEKCFFFLLFGALNRAGDYRRIQEMQTTVQPLNEPAEGL